MLKKNLILPTIISEMDELNILNGKILNPGSFQISENALKRSLTVYKEDRVWTSQFYKENGIRHFHSQKVFMIPV